MKTHRFPAKRHLSLAICALALGACSHTEPQKTAATLAPPALPKVQGNLNLWPKPVSKVAKDPAMEQKISDIMAKMTLEEKVGQLIQPQIRSISFEDIHKYHIGSVLNGGGSMPNNKKSATPKDWVDLADKLYHASVQPSDGANIPLIWGTDAVHGHNNVIGATLFPHNIGLGAARNPELMKKMGAITAREIAATGINWSFAPTLAVTRNDRWGRTYEAFSEDPALVKSYAGLAVEGLQGEPNTPNFLGKDRVIATAKHFLADGGTVGGVNTGDAQMDEATLVALHAQGYITAIESGTQTIMASFSSWNGLRMHGHQYLLTDVLKNHMGFDGLVVGDWNGHEFVQGCTQADCPQAINAGVDIIMVVDEWKPFFENTLKHVKNGVISQARLDDAVRRILRVKMRAGILDKGAPSAQPLAGKVELIGAPEHRAVARQAVQESLVLLKNKNNLLPIKTGSRILVAGDGADNIGKQSGGWSISWQGTGNVNADFPGATSILGGIQAAAAKTGSKVEYQPQGEFKQKPDVAVVVFGEEPYAEGQGDLPNVDYAPTKDLALLKKLKAQGIPVVSVFLSGRPLTVNPELNASNAFVAAWLPGTEGAGVADVIMAKKGKTPNKDFKGKLPFSWPKSPDQARLNFDEKDYAPLFAYGYGLTYSQKDTLTDTLDETGQTQEAPVNKMAIFDKRPQAPWQFKLGNDRREFVTVVSNAEKTGAISYRTVDKLIQEDALQFTFNGKASATAGFFASSPQNFAEIPEYGNLVFDIKVSKPPTGPLMIGMSCEKDCKAEFPLLNTLAKIPADKWETLYIPVSCFTHSGITLGALTSPFYLTTSSEAVLSIYNVHIEPKSAAQASCPK